ncbi:MAG: S-layer homology domain-containing protein [Clostridia bacterium]|nr:S-layer homology domain-containing protein [Clostridia bacterium]
MSRLFHIARRRPGASRRRPSRVVRLAVASLLALLLAFGGPLPAAPLSDGVVRAASPPFVDVDPAAYGWALQAIADLYARGLMTGVDASHFAPGAPLTRAQMAVLLARWKGYPLDGIGPAFADVPPGAWYYAAVEAASGNGLFSGVAPGRFAPGATVTRAMMATVAARALGLDRVARDLSGAALPYADAVAVPDWARGAVAVAADLGTMVGSGGLFRPGQPLTRAEAAVLVDRLLGVDGAAVAREGNRAVAYLNVESDRTELNVGESAQLSAWGHDTAGYLIPAAVSWSADGGSVDASGRFTATAPGSVTVAASLPGRAVSKSLTLRVHQPARLVLGDGTPPAARVGVAFPLAVAVLDSAGQVDPADTGRTVGLTLQAPDGSVRTLTASTRGGWASFPSVRLDQAGAYRLQATAAGLPPVSAVIQAVEQPLGRIVLEGVPAAAVALGQATLSVRLVRADGSPESATYPVHLASSDASVLALPASSALVPGSGWSGSVRFPAPGSATLEASVPGGAYESAEGSVQVSPAGSLRLAGASPAELQAGRSTLLTVRLLAPDGTPWQGGPVTVTLVPHGPHGYDLPPLTATSRGDRAVFTFTPLFSGSYGFAATAPGLSGDDAAGLVQVLPGPAVQLAVHAAPSTILAPGQSAQLTAELADAYGNPVPVPFQLRAVAAPGAGTLSAVRAQMPGPGVAATFTAGAGGTSRTVTFSSPDHPELAAVGLTFRSLASPADVVAGKGLWLLFGDWKSTPDAQLIERALAGGYTHLYLEVATTSDGFYGRRALDDLLWKAHAAGLAVVAWTYPALWNPSGDLAWSRQVIAYATPEGDRADAFAPDIEENLDTQTVTSYVAAVRQALDALGPAGRLVAVTYPPQSRPGFPFAALAGAVDAFAPMAYWHNYEAEYSYLRAYRYVLQAVQQLRQLAGAPVPVSPAGQGFDMFSSSGSGIYSPTALEIEAAARAARDAGAIGFSLYRWGTATAAEWQAMNAVHLP